MIILDCFQDASELSSADLIQRMNIHESRATRLAGTLEAHGCLMRNPQTGKSRLGAEILRLAAAFEKFHV